MTTTLAILTDTPQQGQVYETTYGQTAAIGQLALGGHDVLICNADERADPRATVRALKDLGATHLWLCESVGALSPLLDAGDWLVPDDFIDGTRGHLYTYFDEKAGGYVQQVPPFDPSSQKALVAGAEAVVARPFRRGVYVCVSHTRLETPAEAQFWTRAGGHVVGRFLSPSLALARELDLCVAALLAVTRASGRPGRALPFGDYSLMVAAALAKLEATERAAPG